MNIRDARGFTLPEVLLTVFVIGIGLAAIMTVIPVGAYGVQEGKQLSTATFLANQKLEQVRNLRWVAPPTGVAANVLPANDCLGLSAAPGSAPTIPAGPGTPCFDEATGNVRAAVGAALPWLADENATAIAGFNGYSRNVRITNCGVGAGCTGIVDAGMRLVTVSVTYTPLSARGGASPVAKTVTVNMVITQR